MNSAVHTRIPAQLQPLIQQTPASGTAQVGQAILQTKLCRYPERKYGALKINGDQSVSQADALERQMLELINAERAKVGAGALQLELNLNEAAEDHSEWMDDTRISATRA